MQTVKEYFLNFEEQQDVEMPEEALILNVRIQNGQPVLWAQCDLDLPVSTRSIAIFETGAEMPNNPDWYIGTLFDAYDKPWHVFETVQ